MELVEPASSHANASPDAVALRPNGLLIYDGDCGFCTTSARWIESKWAPGFAVATPWQSLSVERLGELGLDTAAVQSKAWWVDDRGVRGGERAVAAALRGARSALSAVGVLIDIVPIRWLAAVGYKIVARYRYKLPGATNACRA